MSLRTAFALCAFALAVSVLHDSVIAQKPNLPSAVTPTVIPDGLGYNIHFTDARPGEMEQLAASGAKIIRMDFGWGSTEREKGKYDFSAFERLTDSLEKHKIRPLYILDYSNRHYDGGLSPCSEEGRKAFARWAAAAAVHFKNRGIIWEMYNEPNIHFWKPEPKAEDYIKLALEVGKALREAAPNEIYIGPATSTVDLTFLEECFKAGLLDYWDAVSVHPYRQSNPETVFAEYAKLRHLIDQYAPKGVTVPIISGEWGYSSAWQQNFNDELQGKYLPRQWMANLAFNVPVSIWYDWHDDGTDAKEAEHHFGTVNYAYNAEKTPVYEPKPSYVAAKTFIDTFNGYCYNKRLWTGDDDVFVFAFGKENKELKLAVWTTSKEPKQVTLSCPAGTFDAVSYLGEKLPEYDSQKPLSISDGPIYLTPKELAQNWIHTVLSEPSLPIAVFGSHIDSPVKLSGLPRMNPFVSEPQPVVMKREGYQQKTARYNPRPTTVSRPIPVKKELLVMFKHPNRRGIKGQLKLSSPQDLGTGINTFPFVADTEMFRIPLQSMLKGKYQFELSAEVERGNSRKDVFPIYPLSTMQLLDDFSLRTNETLDAAWGIYPDGDKEVKSEQSVAVSDDGAFKITYQFSDGWKFIRLAPKGEKRKLGDENIGVPKALGILMRGDGSGNSVNIRYTDSQGQTFQVHGGVLKEAKPYYFELALDGTNASHWGGPNDGKVHYPIVFDSLIIDGTRKACGPFSVEVYSPVVIY